MSQTRAWTADNRDDEDDRWHDGQDDDRDGDRDDDDDRRERRRKGRPIWHRGAFMLFFIFAVSVAQTLLSAIAIVQFLTMLIAGKPNRQIAQFGRSLGLWLDQTALFQSADSDRRPFPWAPWPPSH